VSKEHKFQVIECFGPTIQGEGLMSGTVTHFLRLGGCGLRCTWCVAENSHVLMADWSQKPIQDVVAGDYVMALVHGKHNSRLQSTEVTDTHDNGMQEVVEVENSTNSLVCTPNHRIYTNLAWREVQELIQEMDVYYVPQGVQNRHWRMGWLAGMIAGDGSYSKSSNQGTRLDIDSKDVEIIDLSQEILQELEIHVARRTYTARSGSLIHKLHTNRKGIADKLRQKLSPPRIPTDIDFSRGWVAGFFDAEGCMAKSNTAYTISQSARVNQDKIDELKAHLSIVGIGWTVRDTGRGVVEFRLKDWVRLLTYCCPILHRKYPEYIGRQAIPHAPAHIVPDTELRHVYDLTTEAGSYVAEGFIVHNCDSMHAVLPEEVKKNRTLMTTMEILEYIKSLAPAPYVTLTGGDPCIQEELGPLVIHLNMAGMKVAVETQGQFFPSWLETTDVITFSPKGPSSGNIVEIEDLYNWLGRRSPKRSFRVCIKVVVFDEADFKYALEVYAALPTVFYDSFYFTAGTPIDTTGPQERIAAVLQNEQALAQMMLGLAQGGEFFTEKVHIGCQQHVLLWPEADRGV